MLLSESRLVMITSTYPFKGSAGSGDEMFVDQEVRYLSEKVHSIVLIPQIVSGSPLPLPRNVSVSIDLALQFPRKALKWYLFAPFWPGFVREIARAARFGGALGVARVLKWASRAFATYRVLHSMASPDRTTIYYTFWRGGATLAALRVRDERSDSYTVTRALGYDLYEERYRPPFQPWTSMYERLDLILTGSDHGRGYLIRRGVSPMRIRTAPIGTRGPKCRAAASDDGKVRLVSCSIVSPVKRVELIAAGVIHFAEEHPDVQVEWSHFGDGEELTMVREMCRSSPGNLTAHLPGFLDRDAILLHYATAPVDLFILASSSETIPLAIQEAASFGIPILATDVGGVSELVDERSGRLLPTDPSPAEIAEGIEVLLRGDPLESAARRQRAREVWEERFRPEVGLAVVEEALADLLT